MKVIIVILCLFFVSTKSAPTVYNANQIKTEGYSLINSDFDSFKNQAENKESIKTYVDKLKEYVRKGVENRKQIDDQVVYMVNYINSLFEATDGYVDEDKHKRFDDKLQGLIGISKTIIESAVKWIQKRIELIRVFRSKVLLTNTKLILEKEVKVLETYSKLGSKMKGILLQTLEEIPDHDSAVDELNEIKIQVHEIQKTSDIKHAVDEMGRIEEENFPAVYIGMDIDTNEFSSSRLEDIIMYFQNSL